MLTRFVVAGLVVCAALFAWAIHDLSTTWNDSLRLPDPGDGSSVPSQM